MTSSFTVLTNVYNLSLPITISQPDGRQIIVKQAGMVKLGPDIWLKDVLYTPTFKCNLVSAQMLARDENCVVSYGPNFCVILDLTSKTQIGVGAYIVHSSSL